MKVDIRAPVGLPVRETANFIAECEAAGFSGVGVHDHQHSGRDVFLTLAWRRNGPPGSRYIPRPAIR